MTKHTVRCRNKKCEWVGRAARNTAGAYPACPSCGGLVERYNKNDERKSETAKVQLQAWQPPLR